MTEHETCWWFGLLFFNVGLNSWSIGTLSGGTLPQIINIGILLGLSFFFFARSIFKWWNQS